MHKKRKCANVWNGKKRARQHANVVLTFFWCIKYQFKCRNTHADIWEVYWTVDIAYSIKFYLLCSLLYGCVCVCVSVWIPFMIVLDDENRSSKVHLNCSVQYTQTTDGLISAYAISFDSVFLCLALWWEIRKIKHRLHPKSEWKQTWMRASESWFLVQTIRTLTRPCAIGVQQRTRNQIPNRKNTLKINMMHLYLKVNQLIRSCTEMAEIAGKLCARS